MHAQLLLDGTTDIARPAAVMTAHYGPRNEGMIAAVARLYVPDGATVVDATYGRGNFWRRTDTDRFRLVSSDLRALAMVRADFTALPFADASADVVVLDPPYIARPESNRFIDRRYRNSETTTGMSYARILDLYREGIAEASRVLRRGGTCWVKCQDTTENRCQRWAVIDMPAVATAAALTIRDLFVLVNPTPPGGLAADVQHQARRNHSYLWIFRKPVRI